MATQDNINENRSRGFIALFRSSQDHWIYPDGREFTEFEAWIDLLLSANHKEKSVRVKNKILKCKRGQSVRSLTNWAERWQWSKSKVYRFMDLLESDGMIETVSETVTTRITICNYDSYQSIPKKNETDTERNGNDLETSTKRLGTESDSNNHENHVNNENNENQDNIYQNFISGFKILQKFDNPLKEDECKKLFKLYGKQNVIDVLTSLNNYKGAEKKYRSVYSTALDWIKKNQATAEQAQKGEQPLPQYLTMRLG